MPSEDDAYGLKSVKAIKLPYVTPDCTLIKIIKNYTFYAQHNLLLLIGSVNIITCIDIPYTIFLLHDNKLTLQ
jgi:hypothetical protein